MDRISNQPITTFSALVFGFTFLIILLIWGATHFWTASYTFDPDVSIEYAPPVVVNPADTDNARKPNTTGAADSAPVVSEQEKEPVQLEEGETRLLEDPMFATFWNNDLSTEKRIELYKLLDSPRGQKIFAGNKRLNESDYEALRQLLHLTLDNYNSLSRLERRMAQRTFARIVRHQLLSEPWAYVFNEWPDHFSQILPLVNSILADSEQLIPEPLLTENLEYVAQIASSHFNKAGRPDFAASVLLRIIAMRDKSPSEMQAFCTGLDDVRATKYCAQVASKNHVPAEKKLTEHEKMMELLMQQ